MIGTDVRFYSSTPAKENLIEKLIDWPQENEILELLHQSKPPSDVLWRRFLTPIRTRLKRIGAKLFLAVRPLQTQTASRDEKETARPSKRKFST